MLRSRDQYIQQLQLQIGFLTRSAAIYDDGDVDEAIRIAVTLRVLFHDTGASTSLLTHLGVKRTVQLLSTATPMPKGGKALPALVSTRFSLDPPVFDFIPFLDDAKQQATVSVRTWLSEEVVYSVHDSRTDIYRRDIIGWAANKDGGAHVDENVPSAYAYLEGGAGFSITLNPDNAPSSTETFKHAHFAALRQMAYEVINSPDIQRLRG